MANQKSAEYPVIEKIIYSQYLHPDVGPLCRPVKKPSDQLVVKLGLAMQNIINLDISTGVLTGTFFVHHSWTDITIPSFSDAERTQDTVAIPVSKIWKPDIVLLNSVEIPEAFDKDALAVVKYTGDVLWCPRAKLAVQCKKTPSGDWQADFAFVSWVHDKSQLDLAINEMGFSLDFFTSDKYNVTNATAKRSEFNCPLFAGAPWVQVVYSMTIQVL